MRNAAKDKDAPRVIVTTPESFLFTIELTNTTIRTAKISVQLNKNWFRVGLKPILPINIEWESRAKLMRKLKIKKHTVYRRSEGYLNKSKMFTVGLTASVLVLILQILQLLLHRLNYLILCLFSRFCSSF